MNAKRRTPTITTAVEAGLVLLLAIGLAMSGGIANALTPTVGSHSAPVGASSPPVGDSSEPAEDPGTD
jgi:hypothetical protein